MVSPASIAQPLGAALSGPQLSRLRPPPTLGAEILGISSVGLQTSTPGSNPIHGHFGTPSAVSAWAAKRKDEMRRLLLGAFVLVVAVAGLAGPAGAVTLAPSGDTCTSATGAPGNASSGNSYTFNITVPAGAPQQSAFAFGASGGTVTNIAISGTVGTLSTSNLPPNTTGEWLLSSPVSSGVYVANVQMSAAVKGPFTVVAASAPAGSFYDPFSCLLSSGGTTTGATTTTTASPPSNTFTVGSHFAYSSSVGGWRNTVTVPGPGSVSFTQALAQTGGASSKPIVQKALIRAAKLTASAAGNVRVTLRPTAAGSAALRAHGSLKVKLTITFSPKGGKPASKSLSLTLRK